MIVNGHHRPLNQINFSGIDIDFIIPSSRVKCRFISEGNVYVRVCVCEYTNNILINNTIE